ncbi:MAG: hypothetical protein WD871_07330 [Xanthobacteraceae bacterium]
MKKYLFAASLIALVSSPAHAQNPYYGQYYANSPNSPFVVADGRIIGRDPDANVRLELRKNALVNDGIF